MSPAKKQAESPSLAPQVAPWSALARIAVSLLVVFHLTAVVIAPFHFATNTRPGVSSPASDVVINVTKPYIDATFLNHGYFLFRAEPRAEPLGGLRGPNRAGECGRDDFPTVRNNGHGCSTTVISC